MPTITPFLWFDTQAEDAARFYTTVFANSSILNVSRHGDAGPGPKGTAMIVELELDGQRFTFLNGGPSFRFTEAISFTIDCQTQQEVDYYWGKLTAEGGQEAPCGWLKDRYGLSWQVVPSLAVKLLNDPDPRKSSRAMKAILGMKKIDIAAVEAAAAG